MTYVVTESCVKCKYTDCVTPCPVNCFHEGANMLVIDPDECINCDACRPVCPVHAIQPDSKLDLEQWLAVNADFTKRWPRITKKKDRPTDAEKWAGVPNKFQKYFDPRPAEG